MQIPRFSIRSSACCGRGGGTAIRLSILGVLTLFHGIAQAVLITFAVLTFLTALLFKFATPITHFPFWTLIVISGSCLFSYFLYVALIRIFSR